MVPFLSICVPSRNRQIYFQETIRALTSSPRTDIEFVFADNSDDPSIMNDFIRELSDERVVYLPSGSKTYSMIDNWERTVAASTGKWITVIGDDDYLDPDIADVLTRISAAKPELEAFEWSRLAYSWPDPGRERPTNVNINPGKGIFNMPKEIVRSRAFLWKDADVSPVGGFSIYHSAISRPLLDKIYDGCKGRYFEHPVVDFDFAFKSALFGQNFAVCERPFSVLGACPKSNSASLQDLDMMRQRSQDFMDELGRELDADDAVKDFPFPTWLGVTPTVMHVHLSLCATHKLVVTDWEKAFVGACVRNCEQLRDRDMFHLVAEGYRAGFKTWKGGRYRGAFNPVFDEIAALAVDVYSGFNEGKIYLSMPILKPQTPAELYSYAQAMVPPIDELDYIIRQPEVRYA